MPLLRPDEALWVRDGPIPRDGSRGECARATRTRPDDQGARASSSSLGRSGASPVREFLALCLVGVNSALGKLSSLGRESIVTLSEALGQELRGTDSVGALSGGLGLVLLSVADESAHSVANRIRGHVAGLRIPRDPPGDREPITLSVGVASLPRHGHSGAALLAHASACLAAARRRGGNQVVSDLSAS